MRKKAEAFFSIIWQSDDDNQGSTIVKDYHNHYKMIDEILTAMPEVIQLVHDDLDKLSQANDRVVF